MTLNSTQSICKSCILLNGFLGISLHDDGRCDFCTDPNYKNVNWSKKVVSNEKKAQSLEDWFQTVAFMQEHRGEQEFDCVIGYSGGKDSTALVDTFVYDYELDPLLITVDTGFMTDVAKQNIRDTLNKMNLYQNQILIEDAVPVFSKLYKQFFFHHDSNEKTLTVSICHTCTDLIHTIVTKEAMKRNILHVIIGFSPDQIARYFYETSKTDTIRDGTPPSLLKMYLSKEDLRWYFTQEEINSKFFPRIIYPYHVIQYDENEIIARIEAKGLIEVGKADPVLTNCHVVKAALMYDLYRFGGLTYMLQYAELVRQQPTEETRRKSRKEWLRVCKSVSKNIFNGTFNKEGMEAFFRNIQTSEEELMKSIERQRENDPNSDQIVQNLELFKSGKLR